MSRRARIIEHMCGFVAPCQTQQTDARLSDHIAVQSFSRVVLPKHQNRPSQEAILSVCTALQDTARHATTARPPFTSHWFNVGWALWARPKCPGPWGPPCRARPLAPGAKGSALWGRPKGPGPWAGWCAKSRAQAQCVLWACQRAGQGGPVPWPGPIRPGPLVLQGDVCTQGLSSMFYHDSNFAHYCPCIWRTFQEIKEVGVCALGALLNSLL